jgi:murein DD-endopeptidase MepM/ murein hydrolase activator NlpD
MIKHDYKQKIFYSQTVWFESFFFQTLKKYHMTILTVFFFLCILIFSLFLKKSYSPTSPPQLSSQHNLSLSFSSTSIYSKHSLSLSNTASYSSPIIIPLSPAKKTHLFKFPTQWKTEKIKSGDTLSHIFKRVGLSPQMVYKISHLDKNTKRLLHLIPKKLIYFQWNNDKQLTALKYPISIQKTLYIEKKKEKFVTRISTSPIEYRTAYTFGTINDSLYLSGKRAGLTDTLIIHLARIFEWDIDFFLDIRKGDSFSILFEEKYLHGEKIGHGSILAAEFINQKKHYQAIRYKDSKNNIHYYTPNGNSLQKAFLRAPIEFSYISSSFKRRRFHPILKRWKAHRGIDYRAKKGTPIRASGDGKVIRSSTNRYNGKYVFIQHPRGIVTKYLHMSRRRVKRHQNVKQGDIIGYVGMTGLAEAPHLHYEFVVRGVHRNPKTVPLPKALPIKSKEKSQFLILSQTLTSQLKQRKKLQSFSLAVH